MADPSSRMLALLSALQNGRGWTGPELALRLETSPRTLRRDVDRLRALGYPIETRTGPGGHYRLVAGAAMPPLLLEDDEAVAVAVGLQLVGRSSSPDVGDDAAAGALRKLEQVLPARLRRKVAAVREATETAPSAAAVPVDLLTVIGEAAGRHQLLRFSYRNRQGSTTRRTAEPYRQVLSRNRWYLLAWDIDRHDWRTFRLDRMAEVNLADRQFAPRELPADTAVGYLEAALREPHHRAVVTFDAPIDDLADRLVIRDGVLESLDDGRCRYTAWVDSFEWLAFTVAMLGVDFTIEEPIGFTDYCRSLRDRLDRAVSA